uniref:Secreted S1 protease protein n=1 Tax=Pristhesancus plagipennis TaxID=1955184 RepID=A0A1Q1NPG1_PRIPG|nr:venom s1 protease 24 [Pristhesancus plagipennis]ATU82933.1 secreted S1 protease protein [Pristhesancus plagipennis]
MWTVTLIVLLALSSVHCQDVVDSSEHGVTEGKMKTNCTCGLSNKSPRRIIGGDESDVNEWPMMVGLIVFELFNMKNVFYCGGTLITHRHVITAGHCIHDDEGKPFTVDQMGFLFGAHDLRTINYDDPVAVRKAEKLIKHPKYVWPAAYDVAIAVMPTITFSKIIGPACLPTERFNIENKSLKVAGWGFITPDGPISDVLKKTNLIGHSHGNCGNYYKSVNGAVFEKNDPYQVCTSQPDTSHCAGDSGGPILWVDPDTNRYTLVAAPSYGLQQCHKHPQVNSDISYFVPWIQQVISETYPEEKTCAKIVS